jgi:undecaprenyl pyrophosphate phosphatase UppP
MSQHLTYLEAVVTGLIQGVTELFPVSSLGHNVLIPALVGGNWASTLNVSSPDSPYLAFIVGLHVATAIAMIAYFWRDWVRIVRGFFTSLRRRSITTRDERLAWMIILATIPVGIVGAALQHEFTKIFARPELVAVFLAINGLILLGSERMRKARVAAGGDGTAAPTVVLPAGQGVPGGPVPGVPDGAAWGPAGPGGPGRPGGPGPEGWSQQPRQQQWQGPEWQGPDPRYGQDGNPQYPGGQHPGNQYPGGQNPGDQYPGNRPQGPGEYGRQQPPPYGQPQPGGQPQYGQPQYGQPQYGPGQGGPGQYGRDPRGGPPAPGWHPSADPRGGYDPRDPRAARGQQRPGGRHGRPAGGDGHGNGHRIGQDAATADQAVAADQRLSTMGYKRAILVGSAQILALLPGISRDGIVTVTGMSRGMRRSDAVRFSFLLSAPVILAAGVLKAKDLTGPMSAGIHGPILVGSLISGVGAYLSIRFLTKYFSEDKSLNPFGIYCLIAGLGSLAYLLLK